MGFIKHLTFSLYYMMVWQMETNMTLKQWLYRLHNLEGTMF